MTERNGRQAGCSRTLQRRRAFSLLEVIIATGILAASTMLLLGMFSTGQQHAQRAEQRVVAQMVCQSKLDELMADPSQLRSVEDEPVEGLPEWLWSTDWSPTSFEGLVRVRVEVTKARPGDLLEKRSAEPRRADFALVRWMRYDAATLEQGAEASAAFENSVLTP